MTAVRGESRHWQVVGLQHKTVRLSCSLPRSRLSHNTPSTSSTLRSTPASPCPSSSSASSVPPSRYAPPASTSAAPLTAFSQVTTRYVDLQPVGMGTSCPLRNPTVYHAHRPCVQAHSASYGAPLHSQRRSDFLPNNTPTLSSSAKDQLTGSSVAIKKIMKPFSTPVLSKRTYRELKLLKHIQHENVCSPCR